MFSYYGSKSKIVDLYPSPKYGRIIEPFAGSARYSLKYFDREVLLVDKYEVIVRIWKWLQQASEKDVLGLPDVEPGDDIRKFNLPDEPRFLMGFCINRGSASPRNIVSAFFRPNGKSSLSWSYTRKRISEDLYKIRHWDVRHGSYEEIENQEATWFIDPPYQYGGEHYRENNASLDYSKLAEWCKSRNGQTIVCENTKADWLYFMGMKQIEGQRNTWTTEAIWSNLPHDYMAQQQVMPL